MSYSHNSSLRKTLPEAKEYCSKRNETLLGIDGIADFFQSVRDKPEQLPCSKISSFWIQSCDKNEANISPRSLREIDEICSANTRLCECTASSYCATIASKTAIYLCFIKDLFAYIFVNLPKKFTTVSTIPYQCLN